jgi:hypothetical protein
VTLTRFDQGRETERFEVGVGKPDREGFAPMIAKLVDRHPIDTGATFCCPSPQGCSTLFVVVHIAEEFEAAERCGVAILRDGVGLIEAQDIVSEAAQSGEDARVAADARGVFAECDVARVVLFVFDAPVFANGVGGLPGKDGAIGQVESGFA